MLYNHTSNRILTRGDTHTELTPDSTKKLSCSHFPRADLETSKLGVTTEICSFNSVDISSCTSGQTLGHKPAGVLISAKMASLEIGRIQEEGNQVERPRERGKQGKGSKERRTKDRGQALRKWTKGLQLHLLDISSDLKGNLPHTWTSTMQ